jgi:hypothetical protein
MITEHQRAVLTRDMPDEGLIAGDVGAVIHIHSRPGAAEPAGYTLEFFSLDGESIAIATVSASDVRPVAKGEIAHARAVAAE